MVNYYLLITFASLVLLSLGIVVVGVIEEFVYLMGVS